MWSEKFSPKTRSSFASFGLGVSVLMTFSFDEFNGAAAEAEKVRAPEARNAKRVSAVRENDMGAGPGKLCSDLTKCKA